MVARVARDFWTSPKRFKLERILRGHFAASPKSGAMCAGECVCLVWAWLDQRGCPRGSLNRSDSMDLEDVAKWPGPDEALWDALVAVRFIVPAAAGGLEWHHFNKLNGDAIRQRQYRARNALRNASGNGPHNGPGNEVDTGIRGSGSGSGSSLSSSWL